MEDIFPLEATWCVPVMAGALALLMLWRLSRVLPLQNLAVIVLILALGQGLLEIFMRKYAHTLVDGPLWRYFLGATLLWMAVTLCSRRLVKLILRPWRANRAYGFWLIGLSAFSVAGFQLFWPALNPDPIDGGQAAMMALFRGMATAILLTVLVPWFIRKRPVAGDERSTAK